MLRFYIQVKWLIFGVFFLAGMWGQIFFGVLERVLIELSNDEKYLNQSTMMKELNFSWKQSWAFSRYVMCMPINMWPHLWTLLLMFGIFWRNDCGWKSSCKHGTQLSIRNTSNESFNKWGSWDKSSQTEQWSLLYWCINRWWKCKHAAWHFERKFSL